MLSKGHEENCGCGQGDCGHVAAERNRYFTGKYMAARDFQDEQTYFLSRHRLHNRLLHGWGIVCGLKVTHHPDYECARRWVVVHPGVALDCCGRELIVERAMAFELPLPRREEDDEEGGRTPGGAQPKHYDPPKGYDGSESGESGGEEQSYAGEQGEAEDGGTDAAGDGGVMDEPFLLALRYKEDKVERVPALYSEGACDPARVEANRVREGAELVPLRFQDVEGDCWRSPGGDPESRCRDDCGDELPGPGGACLDPICPCGEAVPLARIEVNPDDPSSGFNIDLLGRRYLPTPPELLTHIVHVNWPHGGEVTLDRLREEMGGRLEIVFDRKLMPADGDATGISPFTFFVEYGGVQHDIEFLPFDGDHAPLLEDDCRAVFTIDPDYIRTRYDDHRRAENIAGDMVYVTLECDFILDCHGNPVDGDFLRGLFPTGDGVPGGKFKSWFRVVNEPENRAPYEKEDDKRWQRR